MRPFTRDDVPEWDEGWFRSKMPLWAYVQDALADSMTTFSAEAQADREAWIRGLAENGPEEEEMPDDWSPPGLRERP